MAGGTFLGPWAQPMKHPPKRGRLLSERLTTVAGACTRRVRVGPKLMSIFVHKEDGIFL